MGEHDSFWKACRPTCILQKRQILFRVHIYLDLISTTIHTGEYEVFTAKGNLLQGVVYHEWIKIWNADIQRAFTSDFEVYGAKAGDFENAEVDIFVAVK